MPARSDIEAAGIPAIVPHLGIIERAGSQLRYRFIGTALAQQLGCDVTGSLVGSYVPDPRALRSVVELVCASAQPVFITAMYEFEPGQPHYSSLILLPLSEDGGAVNMVAFLRIVRFHSYAWPSPDWLRNARLKIGEPILIEDAIHLERLIADWERVCLDATLKGAALQDR